MIHPESRYIQGVLNKYGNQNKCDNFSKTMVFHNKSCILKIINELFCLIITRNLALTEYFKALKLHNKMPLCQNYIIR